MWLGRPLIESLFMIPFMPSTLISFTAILAYDDFDTMTCH
jgi:hypothetical protein